MDKLATKVSSTLKLLRNERKWSLDIASQKTGVSKAMLGQIERGESSPTIATLWKIASGFNVSFSSFVVGKSKPNQTDFVHSKQNLKQIHQKDDKIRVMTIFDYEPNLGFEVFVIELLPGCTHLSPPHQTGVVEHIIVSSGEIEVLINDKWHTVKQNEGLRFSADKHHGYRNISDTPAVFNDMIHYDENKD